MPLRWASLAASFGRSSRARALAVTELALILGIQVAALAYALVLARVFAAPDASSPRLRRVSAALDRATSSFFVKQSRVVLGGALGAAVLWFALHGLSLSPGTDVRALPAALAAASSVLFGAGLCLACAYLTLRSNVRASLSAATAASSSLDRALRVALRGAACGSLIGEIASVLGLSALFGVIYGLLRGDGTTSAALGMARDVTSLVAGFPLGAALTAMVLQRAGSTYRAAALLGVELAAAQDSSVEAGDPRNPALIGALAGEHLGDGASRSAVSFALASVAHVAVLALALSLAELGGVASLAVVALPFLVRSFFLLGTVFAFSATRSTELGAPSAPLLRAYASAAAIGLSGLLGTAYWLAREHLVACLLAGFIGASTSALVALPLWLGGAHRRAVITPLAKATPPGVQSDPLRTSLAVPSSISAGFEAALVPTLAFGVASALLWHIGERSSLPGGGLAASLVGWAALVGMAPFALAATSLASIGCAARGLAGLGGLDHEAQRRTARLSAAHTASGSARAQLVSGGAAAAFLAVLAIPALARWAGPLEIGILEPVVAWCGALGGAVMLAYAASGARAGFGGAQDIACEIERQLRGSSRERHLPLDFAPSYKPCVDLAARSGLRRLAPYALGVLAFPALLAGALRLTYGQHPDGIALRGLISFVLFAALTGFAAASAIDAARGSSSSSRRTVRSQAPLEAAGESSLPQPAAFGALSELLGATAGPAALTLVVAAAAVGLALAPFLAPPQAPETSKTAAPLPEAPPSPSKI